MDGRHGRVEARGRDLRRLVPQFQPGDEASHTLDRVRAYMKAAGRPSSAVRIEGRLPTGSADQPSGRSAPGNGATRGHPRSVNTMGSGLAPRAHIEAILKIKPALDGM